MKRPALLINLLSAIGSLWLGFVCIVCPAIAANAQTPSESPVLRLETGMHTATIRRIAVDRAGRLLVTVSDDKTARVWDIATGKLLRVLRVPIGAGNEGNLYAVALSSDSTNQNLNPPHTTGLNVTDQNGKTREAKLYNGSYALVIGESKYINGWDTLDGVKIRTQIPQYGKIRDINLERSDFVFSVTDKSNIDSTTSKENKPIKNAPPSVKRGIRIRTAPTVRISRCLSKTFRAVIKVKGIKLEKRPICRVSSLKK